MALCELALLFYCFGDLGILLTLFFWFNKLAICIILMQRPGSPPFSKKKIDARGNKCRYALVTDCSKPLQCFVTFPANIKALQFCDCGKQELCGDAFSPAKCLRILDLSECFIQKLPDCIGQLKQLKFLHAPRIKDEMIPDCITELPELNYLNLRDSHSISALPESIGDMKALMHLDLSGCFKILELPVSFAELKQLVYLDLSACRISTPEAIGGFTKLQHLNLARQTIMDSRSLSEVIGNLTKLRYLNLSRCRATSDQIDILIGSICKLSSLEHLDLSYMYELYSIPASIGNLRKLHTLDLTGRYDLKKLPDSMVKMVNLKFLHVNTYALDELGVSRFNVASLPHFLVHASSDKCSSNIIQLQRINLRWLMIDRLENVKSAKEAQSIKLIEKQKIEELTLKWGINSRVWFVDDKEVLEKLVPPSSVRGLSITGYRSVNIPDWLMGIWQYLPNLSRIDLCDFAKCNNLPPLGQLPNLQEFSFCRMESLEEWNMTNTSGEEGVNEFRFPKLQRLTIMQCGKLRINQCLPRAMYFDIQDCDNVLSSWGESSSHCGTSPSSSLIELSVSESQVPMHQWRLLHHIPALRRLAITSCSDLTASPQIIHSLSSLKELTLFGCRSMTSLLEWLGELTSLKFLEIEDCEGIRSFPDSIQQLTKLEYLRIEGCPTLTKWCQSMENIMKLAHIWVSPPLIDADTRSRAAYAAAYLEGDNYSLLDAAYYSYVLSDDDEEEDIKSGV